MWIYREISEYLTQMDQELIQILIGPRQCGKSSLLFKLGEKYNEVTFDDLQTRKLAQDDPALFLTLNSAPLIIDEVQYSPNIFPELKKIIDHKKREHLFSDNNEAISTQYRLTGSNQILLDKNIKESLAGRAGYYYLNTLSVSEIKRSFPEIPITKIMFTGGWPELYISKISKIKYLNDYIRNFLEKDIVLSAGITKQQEFHTVLGMLAARTGEFLNYSSIAKQSGVKSVTVKEWVSILERVGIIYLLRPSSSNLNKRLTKSPKVYFLDTGLACRLQGWQEENPMIYSPQAGHIFESLALGEIIKCICNYGKNWKLSVWHTKEGEEIDFIIENESGLQIAIDAKMGISSISPISIPKVAHRSFPNLNEIIVVSLGGTQKLLSNQCRQVPISELTKFLIEMM